MSRPTLTTARDRASIQKSTFPRGPCMYRLDTKLAKIRAGNYAKGDFIIADAKERRHVQPDPGDRKCPG